jgi:uncharacterized membrane protein
MTPLGAEFKREPLPVGWWLALIPMAAVAVVCAYVWSQWDVIPERFPIHWNARGVADGFSRKSVRSVFAAPMIFALVALWMWVFSAGVWVGTRHSTPWRKLTVNVLTGVIFGMGVLLSFITMLPLLGEPSKAVFMGVLVVTLVVLIGCPIYAVVKSAGMPRAEAEPKRGVLYCNREDPALFVEKSSGRGLTLNFGHPWAWFFIAWPVLLPVALFFVIPR